MRPRHAWLGWTGRRCGVERTAFNGIRYNRGGPAGLLDDGGDGRPWRLTEGQQATLKAIVRQGPDAEVDGASTWRLIDLCQIVRERFGVAYSEGGMGKLMRSLDLSWQTPRPRHAETDQAAQARFKKGLRASPRAGRGRPPWGRADRGLVPGFGALRRTPE